MPFIPVPLAPPKNNGVVNDVLDANAKRKADTPNGDDTRAEKRAKTEEDKRAECASLLSLYMCIVDCSSKSEISSTCAAGWQEDPATTEIYSN